MTSLTHGADAGRLREIASTMRGEGARVQELGDQLGPLSAMLQEAWGGPDAEHLLSQVEMLRPSIATTGSTLIAWAEDLRGQADQQTAGSGESGGPGGGGAPGGGGTPGGASAFAGVTTTGSARTSGSPLVGQGSSPLTQSVTAAQYSTDGGGGGVSAIGDTESEPGGDTEMSGDISHSKSKGGDHAKLTATETVSTSDESVDAKGRSIQTTTVTQTTEGSIEAGKKIQGMGVDAKIYGGEEVSYSVTAPVGVPSGEVNPLDPASMPEGTSVRLDGSYYAGYGLEGNYRGLIVGLGQESGRGHFVEIAKGEGDLVTVMVGDEDFDRASSEIGFGGEQANVKAGASNGMSTGEATEVTLDLSTPEGREAYNRLVFGGEVPAMGDPGVVDVADLTVMNAHAAMSVSGTAGDLSVGGTLSEWSAGGVQRTHADGTTTMDWTGESKGVQTGGTAHFDADGNPVPEDNTYYLRMEGVDPKTANDFNQYARGSSTQVDAEQNVVLTYTHDDLQSMRMQAAETQAAQINANPERYNFPEGTQMTAEDVIATVEADPYNSVIDVTDGSESAGTSALLAAGSDAEIMRVLAQDPLGVTQGMSLDHHTATGDLAAPKGEVTSRESAT